jgi:hypothetical protein
MRQNKNCHTYATKSALRGNSIINDTVDDEILDYMTKLLDNKKP